MIRTLRTTFLAFALALPMVLAPGSASASPLLSERVLSPTVERSIAGQVRAERALHPEVFDQVQHLSGVRRSVYGTTRLGRPSVVRELRAMGPSALMPMLDALFVSGYSEALDETERSVLSLALVEALGSLRDRRAEPALRAVFISTSSAELSRAAAIGLGSLCTEPELTLLTTHARAARSERRNAAIEGLGACRTLRSVQALGDLLDHASDDDAVIAAARGLSSAASPSAAAALGTREDLGAAAAPALVRAFVRTQSEARAELQVALLTLHHPRVPTLLAQSSATANEPSRRAILAMESVARRDLLR